MGERPAATMTASAMPLTVDNPGSAPIGPRAQIGLVPRRRACDPRSGQHAGHDPGDLQVRVHADRDGHLEVLGDQAGQVAVLGQAHHRDQPGAGHQIRVIKLCGGVLGAVQQSHPADALRSGCMGSSQTPSSQVRGHLPRHDTINTHIRRWIQAEQAAARLTRSSRSTSPTSTPSSCAGSTNTVRRRARLGGLLHEYQQVARREPTFGHPQGSSRPQPTSTAPNSAQRRPRTGAEPDPISRPENECSRFAPDSLNRPSNMDANKIDSTSLTTGIDAGQGGTPAVGVPPCNPSGRQDLNLRPLDPQRRPATPPTCGNSGIAGRSGAVQVGSAPLRTARRIPVLRTCSRAAVNDHAEAATPPERRGCRTSAGRHRASPAGPHTRRPPAGSSSPSRPHTSRTRQC